MSDGSLFGGNVSLRGLRICLALGGVSSGAIYWFQVDCSLRGLWGVHEYVVHVDYLPGLGVLESYMTPSYRIRLPLLTFLV